MTKKIEPKENDLSVQYDSILGDISTLIDGVRRSAARSVNCVMTAAYWLIGKQTDSPDTVWRIRRHRDSADVVCRICFSNGGGKVKQT